MLGIPWLGLGEEGNLGCEKQTRDAAGFPLAKLSKPRTSCISSSSGKKRECFSSCFLSYERSCPCPSFYFNTPHPYSRGRVHLLLLPALGESSCGPFCSWREGNGFKYFFLLFTELSLNHFITIY